MSLPKSNFLDNDPSLPPEARRDWIAVLPLGAHEQHGPHLPFETDTLIVEGVVARLAERLPADLPVTFLPAEPVGYSIEHMDVAGSKTLAYQEAVDRWLSIAGDLSRKGIRKLVMLNAHGGNSPLMTIVATEARVRFGMLAVATSWTRFGLPQGVISPEEKAIGIHGGEIETSVMLALNSERVAMDKAKNFPSRQSVYASRFTHLRAYGPHAFGWKMSDLNRQGVTGNAGAATAEKGEKLITHAVGGLIELLRDVQAFDIDTFVCAGD
ncbi:MULTISPECIES: creatininase family protein [Alphaproteobacteria]|uniref:Creatinine amidohydrolase n=2 Tax=Alphaproteobacteria TaxID=28211 RepID=A0A512HJ00_9HYPH|nr:MULTISPECIES: creatininase family protein [Alphaproteobacteria]GEO85412.1 creatinine amidohydrolase [Ciceribacter naphthalenivorans]GLR21566.1 creatinine amidohydrolase [Ciceribacter naphthalenivorans]GLT04422.1 creatinine amidohydrolase [Sphingomonas psychrolutea]